MISVFVFLTHFSFVSWFTAAATYLCRQPQVWREGAGGPGGPGRHSQGLHSHSCAHAAAEACHRGEGSEQNFYLRTDPEEFDHVPGRLVLVLLPLVFKFITCPWSDHILWIWLEITRKKQNKNHTVVLVLEWKQSGIEHISTRVFLTLPCSLRPAAASPSPSSRWPPSPSLAPSLSPALDSSCILVFPVPSTVGLFPEHSEAEDHHILYKRWARPWNTLFVAELRKIIHWTETKHRLLPRPVPLEPHARGRCSPKNKWKRRSDRGG